MNGSLQRTGVAGLAAAALYCAWVSTAAGVEALRPDCYTPFTGLAMGADNSIAWHVRSGFTCIGRIRIGARRSVESVSVARQARAGVGGASAARATASDRRTEIRIAYQSRRNAPAGEDAFVVRVVTRDRDSGRLMNTHLSYRVDVWRGR